MPNANKSRRCTQEMPKKKRQTYNAPYEEIDAVNKRVLEELQQDSRLTMSELGRRVGMSSPAVTERVRRMEETGVISRVSPGVGSLRTWPPDCGLYPYPTKYRSTAQNCRTGKADS